MAWFPLALLSVTLWSLVSVTDKHLLTQRILNLRSFYLLGTVGNAIAISIVASLNPIPFLDAPGDVGIAALAGLVRGAGLVIMFMLVRQGEVSRVLPVFFTYPVFVAILAAAFLGETVTLLQWVGIVGAVSGALLVNMQRGGKGLRVNRALGALLVASMLTAVADVLTKRALDGLSFWNVYCVAGTAIGGVFAAIGLRAGAVRDAVAALRNRATLGILIVDNINAFTANVLQVLAISLGPVALVSAIVGMRPVSVFLLVVAISSLAPWFLKEQVSPRVLAQKGAAILLTVGGATLVALSRASAV